jgi:hypothetical protein
VIVQISIDRLVEIIVKEVLAELTKRGVAVGAPETVRVRTPVMYQGSTVEIDMTGYRTPVLTENRVRSLERHVRHIVVPAGTICTIGARDVMQERKMKLIFNGNKH